MKRIDRPVRGRTLLLVLVALPLLLSSAMVRGRAGAAQEPILPPDLPWDGASRTLALHPDHPWATPAERSGFARTPRYADTVEWLERLVAAAPELRMVSLGRSAEGRDLWMVIASETGASTPEELPTDRPTLLAHGAIHAGEVDGKDAGLMLLRDMTVLGTKRELLAGASWLFLPILNVDGHERFSRHSRINQRGPEEAGWRTDRRNLNLNRDFTKLDTLEVRRLVGALRGWRPDLYVDMHVTDGVENQYDITWGYNTREHYSPAIGAWLEETATPRLVADLKAMGHVPGTLALAVDSQDPREGILGWWASPRFSNGYGDLRHLPTILLENHALRPFERRVLGTYVFLESVLRLLADGHEGLRAATRSDRELRRASLPLDFGVDREATGTFELLSVGFRHEPSPITGAERIVWTGEPTRMEVPFLPMTAPLAHAERPAAYWVPAAWTEVIDRLRWHGIEVEEIDAPREVDVEMYRIEDGRMADAPYEGRARVEASFSVERRTERFPPGSVRVSTDQPLGDLAMILLEPEAPDSLFRWGFFLGVLQRTEYVEAYIMDPVAERMLAEEPDLRREFESALAEDPELAASPRRRLQWFYSRTSWRDERWNLYPVGRELP